MTLTITARYLVSRLLSLVILVLPAIVRANEVGFSFETTYKADFLRNLSGGFEQASAYIDNLDLILDVNHTRDDRPMRDTNFHLYAMYNNGGALSKILVRDLQVVSNIETGVPAFRLFEAWVETAVGDSGSVLFGLYDLNSEFDALESAGVFLQSAHGIGTDIGQTGINGPSIFPVTSVSVRLAWRFGSRWRIRLAALDGVPGNPEEPGATDIRLNSEDGALIVVEAERRNGEGGRLLIGTWGYTAAFDEWRSDSLLTPPTTRNNAGWYVRGEAILFRAESTLSAFARFGHANGDYNVFSAFYSAGFTWQGAVSGRADDRLGLAVAWADASPKFEAAALLHNQRVEEREVNLELTYRMPINEWLTIQPDLQFVVNPGLDPRLEDAWVAGLRVEIALLD